MNPYAVNFCSMASITPNMPPNIPVAKPNEYNVPKAVMMNQIQVHLFENLSFSKITREYRNIAMVIKEKNSIAALQC